MARAPRRAEITGAALVRLLARLTEADVPESRLQFAQRLAHWVGWADAISLYGALGPAGGPAAPEPAATRQPANDPHADAEQVRQQLTRWLVEPADEAREAQDAEGYAPWRRHCSSRQNGMERAIAPLRERLRRQLAARSPAMARLAEVDAVMEQVLAPQEQRLLATVPGWLGKHFERLRRSGQPGFEQDLQAVLLAELEIRFQPVQGLLEALATAQRHAST
ncbi:DUF3348 family protein [uncultured Aquincola sp.]|uniref:DUF3348 family protein n=1 Tax=uncultured Aquincola sp. TaxID=886556 RepID=UPI0032B231D9